MPFPFEPNLPLVRGMQFHTMSEEGDDLRGAFSRADTWECMAARGRAQPPPYVPWFASPHRASADLTMIVGPWSSLGLSQAPGVYGLDTGCVWGGALTALCLETREHVSVPCDTAQHTGGA